MHAVGALAGLDIPAVPKLSLPFRSPGVQNLNRLARGTVCHVTNASLKCQIDGVPRAPRQP